MSTQHTATPWRAEVTQTAVWVGTPKGESKLNEIVFHTDILGLKHEYVEQKLANAAFIVRACNNHEALVTALGASSRMLTLLAELIADGQHANKGQFISAQCSLNAAALKAVTQ